MTTTSTADQPLERSELDVLFRPQRLAFVGASDKNLFSRRAFAQQQRLAPDRPVALVNPNSAVVHGAATVASCRDVPGGIDCAYLLTPQAATGSALDDAAAAGARAAVVLSQGWAEEGEEGAARQRELVAHARGLGVVLLGPNHLGFANLWDGVAACGLGLDLPLEPGAFALVSQSGAVGSSLVGYAARNDVRFSWVVTTGNEAMVTIGDVLHYVLDDPNTRAVGVFAETLRKPEVFRGALAKAAELGKAVVVLKAGTSELAARTAAAHTGALVGDDRVIEALLRQHGAVRVRTLEDLVCTGVLAADTGPLRASGVGVLSVSGGACDLIADRGEEVGLRLPALSDETSTRLAALLPPYGHAQNPLDVTGGALADPDVWRKGIEALATEPSIGLVGVVTSLPAGGEPQRVDTFAAVGESLARTRLPGVVFPQAETPQSAEVRTVKASTGVRTVLPSVDRFVVAAAAVGRWSDWLRARGERLPVPRDRGARTLPALRGRVSEQVGRSLLEAAGVPVVPAELVQDADQAVSVARGLGGPVVLKLCSPDVAHKTELGGVELDLRGEDEVRGAYERVVARAAAAGVALEGVLVSPMRPPGVELIVGIVRDPDWGLVLAVGLGGALVEVLQDSALRVLPVSAPDVREMLRELRGAALLDGVRGAEPADVDAVVSAVLALCDLAEDLGDAVESVEVNPLLVTSKGAEALDVLVSGPRG